MNYQQIVQPNVAINENAGWCLSYARRVFGAPVVEASAWAGWMSTEHPHEDRNWPKGVAFPVWFDWTGDVGSGRFQYGHVAVMVADGTVWSSPLSGYGRAWFKTVDDLTRAFGGGMSYVGWSEDISDVRVIKGGNQVYVDKAEYDDLLNHKAISIDAQPYKDAVIASAAWTGDIGEKPENITPVLNDLQQFKRDNARATSSESATELKPGLYRVQ